MTRNLLLTFGLVTAFVLGLSALRPAMAAEEAAADLGAAPDFTLKDHEGNDVTLSEVGEDSIVVLEWINFECPYVVRHHSDKFETMLTLADEYKGKNVKWLAINSTSHATVASNKADVEKNSLPYPILDDSSGEVGKAYGAKTTPHMYIIKDGKILYNGGIDNDPRGNMSEDDRVNYVKQALDQVIAGETVTTPRAKPYGCSVKYAK